MVGGFLLDGAHAWLSDAANYYNEDVLGAVRAWRPLPLGIGVTPAPGGAVLAVRGST